MEHLDRYERAGIDEAFIDDVTEEERFAARLAAERELEERDALEGRLTGRRRGLPAALEGAPQLPWLQMLTLYLPGAAWSALQHTTGGLQFRGRRQQRVKNGCNGSLPACLTPLALSHSPCLPALQRSWTRMSGVPAAAGGWRRRRLAWMMRTRSWWVLGCEGEGEGSAACCCCC
jgi:hypothetical protein